MTQTEPTPTTTVPAPAPTPPSGPAPAPAKTVIPVRSLFFIAAAAAGFAAWMPGAKGPGVFLPIVALLAGAAILSAATERKALNWIFAAVGLALITMTAVLDTGFTGPINLLAGLIFAALAVSAPTTWTKALLATLTPPAEAPYTPGAVVRTAAALKRPSTAQRAAGVIRGILLGGVLVAVFWSLFASADQAFAHLTERLLPDWDLGLLPLRFFLFVFTTLVVTAFVLSAIKGIPGWLTNLMGQVENLPFKLGRVEWMVALGLLNLLFLVFAVLQVVVLFQGHDHILTTAGLTYAEYAREGFFQLLFAAALAIPVVALSWTRSHRSGKFDETAMKVLLGMLCLLTLVVVGSALRRLDLYEEAFGFTGARLSAHTIALWLGAVLLAMILAGAAGRTRHLFLVVAALTAFTLIAFSAINPEAAIARRNLERYEQTGKIDMNYLSSLGADAAPVLLGGPGELRDEFRRNMEHRVPKSEPWSSANLSRIRARGLLNR